MIHGVEKAFFATSYAFLGQVAVAEFVNQRCIIEKFNSDKKRWQVRLVDARFKNKQVLVPEKDLVFDCYGSPPELVPGPPEHIRIVDTGAAGNSLVACKDLKQGDIVLIEKPLMVIGSKYNYSACWTSYATARAERPDSALVTAFDELSDGDVVHKYLEPSQSIYDKMLDCASEKFRNFMRSPEGKPAAQAEVKKIAAVLAKWKSNAHTFTAGTGGAEPYSALYRFASKGNHSCDPNCCAEIDVDTGCMIFRAQKKIKAGDHLTASYMSEDSDFGNLPLALRRERLFAGRGFTCLCERCLREESDGSGKKTEAKDYPQDDKPSQATEPEAKLQSGQGGHLLCSTCERNDCSRKDFSSKQLQKGDKRRCKQCTAGAEAS
eukprot:TRINITY_DN88289_c0_g1_i1.p1 TRINITY_DN88289_c0_g1~~TRINITY_DN88289_c0_g1_i1.p1  ORF type:complete len:378 (-),score=69.66 TRINITY_DN88289_c0_g1_i1:95-1228(-)